MDVLLLLRWNYLIGGLNPFGYHVVNVILHSVVTFLFARLCRQRLETTQRTSLFSAGLFAIHSVHTEAVRETNSIDQTKENEREREEKKLLFIC